MSLPSLFELLTIWNTFKAKMEGYLTQNISVPLPLKTQLSEEDSAVESMLLMNSPWPVTIILASYLYFVLKLGPQYMANRKPYDLKEVMILYNLGQVVINSWFLIWLLSKENSLSFIFQQSCAPNPLANIEMRKFMFRASWVWLMTKISDLIDTVIFVLRKKYGQVSFLHIYHHTCMVISVWAYLKYVRGEQGVMIGIVNSSVHIVMYSYYFLSALGPSLQPYLWWKRHITKMQLFQFWFLMLFFSMLLIRCELTNVQKMYNWYAFAQGIVFTTLFLNFYHKSYRAGQNKSIPAEKTD